jgi:hypothetical protein
VTAKNYLPVADRKGAWQNNVFIKRLWLTIKYKEV